MIAIFRPSDLTAATFVVGLVLGVACSLVGFGAASWLHRPDVAPVPAIDLPATLNGKPGRIVNLHAAT